MATEQQVLGYVVDRTGQVDRRFFAGITDVQRHAEYPPFGQEFHPDVEQLYNDLIAEASNATDEEAAHALNQLLRKAGTEKQGKWSALDLNDPLQRQTFARSLRGFAQMANQVQQHSEMLALSSDQLDPRQRQLQLEKFLQRAKEKAGLDESFDRKYLLRLLGDLAFVSPDDIPAFKAVVEKEIGFFDGMISDEMHILLSALEAGREGGTLAGLRSLKNISNLSAENYAALLKMLKPNEIFYIAQLPFEVDMADGSRIITTVAEVTDFLMTPEGIKTFRMHPDKRARDGLSAYIKWLEQKYPNAKDGINLTTRLKIVDTQSVTGWKQAMVLDEGRRGLEGLTDPYVRMGENTTWNSIYNLATGMVNTVVDRGRVYRWGANTNLGPEMQKAANAYAFYLDRYNNFDAWMRRRFPRFRSLGEYMTNAATWLWPQSKLGADVAEPFSPRLTKVIPGTSELAMLGGVEVVPGGRRTSEEIEEENVFLLHTFFGVEADPANDIMETVLSQLLAKANGFYINENGDQVACEKLGGDALIDYAWNLESKIRDSVAGQRKVNDPELETLTRFRTYYPLPPDIIIKKLESMGAGEEAFLKHYDFKGLFARLGGKVDPSTSYIGHEGALAVARQMGSGIWSVPDWGGSADNYPEKHGGYEQKMLELQAQIVQMAVGSNQSQTDELLKAAGTSAIGGHQDLAERLVHGTDELINAVRGLQGNEKQRVQSVEEFLEAYAKAISICPFLSQSRGFWWLYRYATARAKYMLGIDESPLYLHAKGKDKRNKRYQPVLAGEAAAKIHEVYDYMPEEALAILGFYVDGKDVVNPAAASGYYAMAMKQEKGQVVPHMMRNLGKWYDHNKPIGGNVNNAYEKLEEKLWEILMDSINEPMDNKVYYDAHH